MYKKYFSLQINRHKLILAIVAIISLGLGFTAGFYGCFVTKLADMPGCEYADGWNAAREKLKSSGNPMAALPGFGYALSGTVKSIDGQKLVLATALQNPLDDEKLRERTALITDKTEIILRKNKTAEDLEAEKAARAKEMEEIRSELAASSAGRELLRAEAAVDSLNKQIMSQQNTIMRLSGDSAVVKLWSRLKTLESTGPMAISYKEAEGKIDEIKSGFLIQVTADQNIGEKREFTAKKIIVSETLNLNHNLPSIPSGTPLPASPYGPVVP